MGKPLSDYECYWLILQPDTSEPHGIRDFLLIRSMLTYGLRIWETMQLRWSDIDFEYDHLIVNNSRGGNSRLLHLHQTDKELLQEWWTCRFGSLCNSSNDSNSHVFTSLSGSELSASYINRLLHKYGKESMIRRSVKPSVLRNTFAVNYYQSCKDLRKVQLKLGHKSIKTTKRYLQAHDFHSFPFYPLKVNLITKV